MTHIPANRELRLEVEELFTREARLLDNWDLKGWLTLLAPDARYLMPPLDSRDAQPIAALYIIIDDRARIEQRVSQLMGSTAWAESPHSRTRRIISCVTVDMVDGEIAAEANFAVWRFKHDLTDAYVGQYKYRLVRQNGALLIRERRVILDNETLRPQGKISIIL